MIELAIERALSTLSRADVEAVAQVAIDLLDRSDPEPDLEDGDEDCCLASDDRGSSDLPFRCLGFVESALTGCDDHEASVQPVEWREAAS